MGTYNLVVVVGSLRKESLNKKLAQAMVKLFPSKFKLDILRVDNLPLYNQDMDATPTAEVSAFKQAIKKADGVLFLTAEYNRSMPGVLKNALDIASRPYGDNVWQGKPAAIGGISIGAMGTCMAQQHLRNVLAFLDMPTMAQPELYLQNKEDMFDVQGNLAIGSTKEFIQGWVTQAAAWYEKALTK